ncbi:Complex III assembly protein translocase and chaperone [Microbotryomycetes sp. JL221]|nr:Complex III assembly protein translocase and chaperone [Microbotryomycetes sp. JL221]
MTTTPSPTPSNDPLSSSQRLGHVANTPTPTPTTPSTVVDVDQTPSTSSSSGLKGFMHTYMDGNPYFSAGFGLMALGVGATFLRRASVQFATLAQRRMLVSLEISSKDPSYLWFLQWMSHQTLVKQQQQLTRVAAIGRFETWANKIKSHELAVETKYEQRQDGSSTAEFSLVPGPGTHYFRYNGAWFQVKRERATNMLDLHSGAPWETVHLTTLSKDRNLFPQLLQEARQLSQASQIGRTVIYTAWGAEWRPFGQPRARRLLDSVVLDKDIKQRIVDDVEKFMKRGRWYFDRGIPYRRGYLLYGPPGSGKSSFIQALAGSLEYNICVLNLSERGLTDDKLNHLLANAPERSIVLLEDVDAAFAGRQQSGEQGFSGNVTFSGLLNALDGVASSTSQRIMFMTTNHIERLDPALIRPGRVDLKELIDDATPIQVRELFTRFYRVEQGDEEGDHADQIERFEQLRDELVQRVESDLKQGLRVSMAAVQGHFIRSSPEQAVQGWDELVRMAKEDKAARQKFASSP